MLHILLSTVLAPLLLSADAPLETGTQLVFRGDVAPVAAEDNAGGKSFDLTLWVVAKSDAGAELFWLIEERGRGAFPWTERFGRMSVDARWHAAAGSPALLYDRGEGRSVVPIPLPLLGFEKPPAAGLEFGEDKLNFHVDQLSKVGERPAWQVSVRDPFGPKRVMMVDQNSPLVLAQTEKVVMGRGEEYQLKLEFVGQDRVVGEALTALVAAAEKLTTLRGKLNLPAQSQEVQWNVEQVSLLKEQLPALAAAAAATPLEKLAADAGRDLQVQAGRSDAVSQLVAKYHGQEIENKAVFGDDNPQSGELAGNVTVLHFWEYRDEPLQEPYGQVGYLDYLYQRRKADGLRVYGVAVDGRLADEATRAAGERSVRKLKDFMNISYPVLLDAGTTIKQFGDPRVVGASLPLFVVIGPDKKVAHYHVGHYEVRQDQGLKELDDAVTKALGK